MDRSKEKNSAILSVFKHYDRLSSSLNISVILPYLQEHRLVPLPSERDGIDFYRSLAGEKTEKRKAMALLTKVMECPKETWFDEFTNILSRIPDYKNIAEDLHADYKLFMKGVSADATMTNPSEWVPECDSSLNPPQSEADEPTENNTGTCNSKDTQDSKSSPGQPLAQATAITNVQVQAGSSIDADTLQEALRNSSFALGKYVETATKLREAEKTVVLLEREKESAKRELEKALGEHQTTEADLKSQNIEVKNLKGNLEELTQKHKKIATKLSEAEKNVMLLRSDKEVLEDTKREVEKSLKEHKVQLREVEMTKANLKSHNIKVEEEMKVLKRQIEELTKEYKKVTIKLSESENWSVLLETDYKAQLSEMKIRETDLKSQIELRDKEVKMIKEQNEKEMKRKQQEFEETTARLADSESDREATKQELKKRVEEYKAKLREMESQIHMKDDKMKSLLKEVERLSKEKQQKELVERKRKAAEQEKLEREAERKRKAAEREKLEREQERKRKAEQERKRKAEQERKRRAEREKLEPLL